MKSIRIYPVIVIYGTYMYVVVHVVFNLNFVSPIDYESIDY